MIHQFKAKKMAELDFEFDITLTSDKRVYCFIGKNGIGKTQLLEQMVKSLLFSHTFFNAKDNTATYTGLF